MIKGVVTELYDLMAEQMFQRKMSELPDNETRMIVIEKVEDALERWQEYDEFKAADFDQPKLVRMLFT